MLSQKLIVLLRHGKATVPKAGCDRLKQRS